MGSRTSPKPDGVPSWSCSASTAAADAPHLAVGETVILLTLSLHPCWNTC